MTHRGGRAVRSEHSHSAQEVLTILQALSRTAGKTVIMVTHDPKAAAFGSRSVHLEKGELVN